LQISNSLLHLCRRVDAPLGQTIALRALNGHIVHDGHRLSGVDHPQYRREACWSKNDVEARRHDGVQSLSVFPDSLLQPVVHAPLGGDRVGGVIANKAFRGYPWSTS